MRSSGSSSATSRPVTAQTVATVKLCPATDASCTSERSASGKPSSRAATSACSVSGISSSSPRSPTTRYDCPVCSSTPRSASMRTVSTAYIGTPSARPTRRAEPVSRQTVDVTGDHRLDVGVGESIEMQDGRAPNADSPVRPAVAQLGPGQGQHEDRRRAAPLQQRLEEVEQTRVGPVQVLEDEHRRAVLSDALEEPPPGAEELVAVARWAVETDEVTEPRLDPASLLRVGDVLLEAGCETAARAVSSSSVSAIRARPRTISASAQKVTPSP